MKREEAVPVIEKLRILSVRRLADLIQVPREELARLSLTPEQNYAPFGLIPHPRPFQWEAPTKPRPIDNPLQSLRRIQKRIYKKLLKPICFPDHILGAVPKRNVRGNAERHLGSDLLVTLDIKQCFPSITNVHVYRVWAYLLECSPPVASLLTKLTTFSRHLPQGAATSPLLANLFICMIDGPIRTACEQMNIAYSTWIDDLAFSGERARELVPIAASTLRAHGLRLSHKKVRIMGPSAIKLLTGTRLGASRVRAPREKLSRIRSGIHKLRTGLVMKGREEEYIGGLVGQLRFIHQLCPSDVGAYARKLIDASAGLSIKKSDARCLAEWTGRHNA